MCPSAFQANACDEKEMPPQKQSSNWIRLDAEPKRVFGASRTGENWVGIMSNSLRLPAPYRVPGENQAKAVVRSGIMRPRRLGSDPQRELLKHPLARYVGPHQFI